MASTKEEFSLSINGERRTVTATSDTPLLWVLRDSLGLTGTKYGCGMAQCGACTVLLNGSKIFSCRMPVSAVGNASVVTIEGLSADGSHPLQKAWISEQVPQCGYCQSGMIMSAVNLLEKNPEPTEEDIDNNINNICRCGTYTRIKKAILKASEELRQ